MANMFKLEFIKEFELALADYEVSAHAKKILASTPLVIFLGVFGSGRNSIINELVKSGKYHFIISDTTRPPKVRNGVLESHGLQYFFRSEQEVLADIKNGEFLEAEIIHGQQVSGMSIRELERAHQSGKIPVNEVDIEGAYNVLSHKPDATMIFIVPPNYDEWLRRLRVREIMSQEEFNNRMRTAERILKTVINNNAFKFVINNSVTEAAARVDELIHKGIHSELHDQEAKEITFQLLKQIREYHKNLKPLYN